MIRQRTILIEPQKAESVSTKIRIVTAIISFPSFSPIPYNQHQATAPFCCCPILQPSQGGQPGQLPIVPPGSRCPSMLSSSRRNCHVCKRPSSELHRRQASPL